MTEAKFIKEQFWSTLEDILEVFPEFDSIGEYFVQVDDEPYSSPGGFRIDIFENSEDFGYDDSDEFLSDLEEGIGLTGIEVYILDPPNETSDKRLELTFKTPSGSEIEFNFDLKQEYTKQFYRLEYFIEYWTSEHLLNKPIKQLLKRAE